MLRTWMSCKKWLISQRLLEHSVCDRGLKYRKTSYDSNNRNVTEIAIMSITGLENIRTMADVRADQNRPVGGEDLDRNAFLRLFTTQLQNQNPLDPMKNEQFVAQLANFQRWKPLTRCPIRSVSSLNPSKRKEC